MHSIPLGACTTNTVNLKNGGRTLQAEVSRLNKIASSNSTPVWEQIFFMAICGPQLLTVAYTIDDGKGGKIHVNVSY